MPKKLLCGALLVVMISGGVELACRLAWLHAPEEWYYDVWHQLAGSRHQPRHVVLVAIDDATRLEHQAEPLVFWGPHFARAIEVLRRVGVKVIGLDLLFSMSAESWLKSLNLPGDSRSRNFDLTFRQQLASGPVVLAGSLVFEESGKSKVLLPLPDYYLSLPGQLSDVGVTNFYNDPDGVVRRFFLTLTDGDGANWQVFAKLLAARAGVEPRQEPPPLNFIGYLGPPETVPRVSFQRLLAPQAEQDPVVQGLKDKVIIIAAESKLADIHQTPYARRFLSAASLMMSGAEVHANLVETLLSGRYPRPLPGAARLVYLLFVVGLGTLAFFRYPPGLGLAALGLLFFALAFLGYLFFRWQWIIPVGGVQLGLILSYLGVLGLRLSGEERERARLRQIFGRYVSEEVLEKLLHSGKPPDLGGEAVQVTVLFADVRNFTAISEQLAPHDVVDMLNAYFSRVCEPILEQGGTVDKFVGDAVMAVFGSPVPYPDHARRAVAAALAMARQALEFRAWMSQRFPGENQPQFQIGIGLHTGAAVAGNIGSPKRFEFTTIGDTVNTASRLEGLTKELGWDIVASSATLDAAGPGVITGGHQEVHVKGRIEAIEVWEVKGLAGEAPALT